MDHEHNLLILSDLHLSEGLDPATGKTSPLEDFLRDDAFARFLRYHERIKDQPRFGGRPWLLILNGDVFDFLQVVSVPEDGRPLRLIKGVQQRSQLSPDQRRYGLGTTAMESAWKMRQIARGHPRFFAALAWFVSRGNRIVVLPGNHDIELRWKQVQERFVVEAKRAYMRDWRNRGGDPPPSLAVCRQSIRFFPWIYLEPGRIYVEHGGQYEALNHFPDFLDPVRPDDPDRIVLPWGSLFVRYVFNRVETIHPFADNLKPLTRYVSWTFRSHPLLSLGVLLRQGWAFAKASWTKGPRAADTEPRRERRTEPAYGTRGSPLPTEVAERIRALAREQIASPMQRWIGSLLEGLILVLTFLITAGLVGLAGLTLFQQDEPRWMAAVYAGAAAAMAYLRRCLAQLLAWFPEHSDLLDAAFDLEEILRPAHAVSLIVMGHNHDPTLERLNEAWYVNTGTWVPLYQMEGPIEARETLTFLRVTSDHEGPPELLRWDDAAGAATPVVLQDSPRD